jgi:hypothetical protein
MEAAREKKVKKYVSQTNKPSNATLCLTVALSKWNLPYRADFGNTFVER